MKNQFLTLLLLLVGGVIYGQHALSGHITSKLDNTPLVGANIYFPELAKGVVSDAKGNYFISYLPKGEQLVTFSFIGYKTEIKKIILNSTNQQLNIALSPLVIQGEEVVISGNFAGTQHVNTVKINALESKALLQVASPSFITAIASIPGVDMISKGPGVGTPVIRGLSTSNILLLNNGIPMQNFQFSENHPYIIDESNVGKVEVIKGPASLLYGSGAVGGIINVIPKNSLPLGKIEGEAMIKYFTNTDGMVGNIGIRGTNNNIVWGLSGNVNSNKDYIDGLGRQVANSRFNTNSVKANVGLIDRLGSFRIFTEYSQDKLGLTVPPSISKVLDDERKNNIWYQDLTNLLVHSKNIIYINNIKTDVNIAWQQNHRKLQTDFDKPFFTAVDMLLNTLHYSARSTVSIKSDYKLSTGIQGMWQNNKNNVAPDHVLPDATINEFSAFALGQYQTEKLNMEAGLRYTFYHVFVPEQLKNGVSTDVMASLKKQYSNVSFSLGATYHITEQLLFRANIASAFRSPNLAELTQDGVHSTRYEKGDPNLKVQRNTEADLGLHLHTVHATVDLSGFYNHVNNYIYLSPSTDTTTSGIPIYYYQQNKAVLFGGEAKVHIHPHPVHWLHLMADWSYVVGKKAEGGYLPFIPAQKFKFEVKIEKKKLSIFRNIYFKIGTDIALTQNRPAQFETATEGYWLLNTGIGTDILVGKQLLSVTISGNNLFNTVYQDHLSTLKPLGIYDPGRNIALVLRIPIGIKN